MLVCKNLHSTQSLNGELAQLARAPALHAGGHRFESVILHQKQSQKDFVVLKKRLISQKGLEHPDTSGGSSVRIRYYPQLLSKALAKDDI